MAGIREEAQEFDALSERRRQWSAKGGKQDLAKNFKGPADFCVMGDTVYVPDLPGSQLRIIRLGR